MLQKLEQKVLARLKAGKLRNIAPVQARVTNHDINGSIYSDEDKLVDFSSNDYLGLARSRSLFHRIDEATREYASKNSIDQPVLGSTGSRLLTGKVQH